MSVNAAIISQEHKLFAKINESLLYKRNYAKTESNYSYSTYIYHDSYLNQSLLTSNGSFHGTNELRLLVNISTHEGNEAGDYFVIVYADTLNQAFGCLAQSRFVSFNILVQPTIWYVQTLQIFTTGKT